MGTYVHDSEKVGEGGGEGQGNEATTSSAIIAMALTKMDRTAELAAPFFDFSDVSIRGLQSGRPHSLHCFAVEQSQGE